MPKKEFLYRLIDYGHRLDAATNFDSIHKLWRETSLPYFYQSDDPLSGAYRSEVLDLYGQMTKTEYNVNNELTSTKQSNEQFEMGFPWTSSNLQVAAEEYIKISQAMRAIHECKGGTNKIIEFGAGWGNLAIPLAKSGQDVTVVDIDLGFLQRIERIASRENTHIKCLHCDFINASKNTTDRYDFAVFQASFHHCLNFVDLIVEIREKILVPGGRIVFLSEPIFDTYPFPWGLRFDGESIWAIMRNKWLELGFERDFFVEFLRKAGFYVSVIPGVPGQVGNGWLARLEPNGIPFEDWVFPEAFSETFHHAPPGTGLGRFCRSESRLPSLSDCAHAEYVLDFHNFGVRPLRIDLRIASRTDAYVIQPGMAHRMHCMAQDGPVEIASEVFSPKLEGLNEDTRLLGPALLRVAMR